MHPRSPSGERGSGSNREAPVPVWGFSVVGYALPLAEGCRQQPRALVATFASGENPVSVGGGRGLLPHGSRCVGLQSGPSPGFVALSARPPRRRVLLTHAPRAQPPCRVVPLRCCRPGGTGGRRCRRCSGSTVCPRGRTTGGVAFRCGSSSFRLPFFGHRVVGEERVGAVAGKNQERCLHGQRALTRSRTSASGGRSSVSLTNAASQQSDSLEPSAGAKSRGT